MLPICPTKQSRGGGLGPQRGLMQQSPKLPAYCCRDSQRCREDGDPSHYSYTVEFISIAHPL